MQARTSRSSTSLGAVFAAHLMAGRIRVGRTHFGDMHRENAARPEPARGSGLSRLTAHVHVNNCFTVKQLFLPVSPRSAARETAYAQVYPPPPMPVTSLLAAHSALPEFTFARADTT